MRPTDAWTMVENFLYYYSVFTSSAGMKAGRTCNIVVGGPAANCGMACLRPRDIICGLDDSPLVKAPIVAMRSLIVTSYVMIGKGIVARSWAILVAIA